MVDYKVDFGLHMRNFSVTDTSDLDYASHLFLVKDRSDSTFEMATIASEDLEAKNAWLKQLKTTFRVFQRQELQKRKADLETGKIESLALSVQAESTTLALRNKVKKISVSTGGLFAQGIKNTSNTSTPEVASGPYYGAATPFLSCNFLLQCFSDIMSGPEYKPDDEDVLIPPKSWNEWLLYESDEGEEYYYNKLTRTTTWTIPEGATFN